jgi:uncharacterized protein (TIGR02266 family)
MTDSEQRVENRVPIALRIKLRFRKKDTFVSKFATNISSNGMFISSRKPKEQGTLLRFELRLADDSTVIAGQGRVAWVRAYDPDHPKRPHGMGIEFTALNQQSRETISQIVARRVEQGLGEEDEIPFAAKRPPAPRAEASQPAPPAQPAPAAISNGSTLAVSDIDAHDVDIGAAVARARALVGSTPLDDELEKLYRVSAAPVAETVDEASNNLARMLGGTAVQAKRIRHADPPTGVEINAAPAADPAAEAPAADDQANALETAPPPEPAPAESESAPAPNGSPGHYSRAQTDASPDVIDEFDIAASTRIQEPEEPLESLPVIESDSHAPADAPMHLEDSSDESLDIDIDEATPNPEPNTASDDQAPNAEEIDLSALGDSSRPEQGDDEFAESTSTTMDLTDLIDIPVDMKDGDEIDIDID